MLPFLFIALTMQAGRPPEMIDEVGASSGRSRTMEGLPGDYAKVSISTSAALKKMIPSGLLAVFAPIIVGLFGTEKRPGGMLARPHYCSFLVACDGQCRWC